ncbi:MAG TPA: YwdI family protein [Niallia sp.]|nr:YwdI family protein [Niallia sp.]
MSVSIQQLLTKMEEQLKEAKTSNSDARIRERVYAIKSLCELVLEQEGRVENISYQKPLQQASYPVAPVTPVPIQTIQTTTQTTKLDTDEGNGDSLFDF